MTKLRLTAKSGKAIWLAAVFVLLALCMAAGVLLRPGIKTARAAAAPDTSWYTADTSAAEYQIGTADQLAGLAEIVNGTADGITRFDFKGRTLRLTQDISLADYGAGYNGGKGWIPIGWYDLINNVYREFWGVFDGGGHTVSDLYIDDEAGLQHGLFGA
ncbi:MAG: hypothetical protein FWE62_04915, partial [Firmicutes bacterium]|nr:hypothetical protein [Bacillota bacterium]